MTPAEDLDAALAEAFREDWEDCRKCGEPINPADEATTHVNGESWLVHGKCATEMAINEESDPVRPEDPEPLFDTMEEARGER